MSTLVMTRAKVDPQLAEQMAKAEPNPFAQLASTSHEGLIRHRVFAGDGELVVIDEWERPEDYEAWRASPPVAEMFSKMMGEANMTDELQVLYARELDLGDKVG